MRSAGNRPASGMASLRYSAIASVSQMVAPSSRKQGTRIDDDNSRTDSSCVSVRRSVRSVLERDQTERMIGLLIAGLNEVDPDASRPVVVG